jgi:hypothetical protein
VDFKSYIVQPDRNELVSLTGDDAGIAQTELIELCRHALDDPDRIEAADCGLRVRWSAPPGILSCWVDGVPVRTSLFLKDSHERRALNWLHEASAPVFADRGIDLTDGWTDQEVAVPCVVSVPLPFGTPAAHAIARDLSFCWATAYFQQ